LQALMAAQFGVAVGARVPGRHAESAAGGRGGRGAELGWVAL